MKRAFLRKVKPVSCSSCVDHTLVGESEQTPSGVKRRTRTSAAMVGLALSMGATSLLAPRQGDSATAAESKRSEATPSSVSHVAARPAGIDAELASASTAETVDYVVRQGQTLRQIAEHYQISVERLAAANKLNPNATLRAGQVLKVPAEQFAADKLNQAQSPQLLALADLSRLPTLNPVDGNAGVEVQTERNQALNRLEQQRSKLRDRLAELRRGESENLVADTSIASAGTVEPVAAAQPQSAPAVNETAPSVAALPSPVADSTDLDWMRVNQALVLPAKTPTTIAQSVEQPEVPVAGSLARSNQIAARSTALPTPSILNNARTVEPDLTASTYQVHIGDTVAQIARAHNVSQSELISANGLSNPNVIFVGQTLRVPAAQLSVAEAAEPSVPSVLPASVASQTAGELTNVTVPTVPVQAGSSSQVAVVSPGLSASASSTVVPSTGAEVSPSAATGRNPYVQNLLSEVKTLRERRLQRVAAPQQPTVVAAVTAPTTPLRGNLLNASQPAPRAVSARTIQPVRSPEAAPTVVAAAPLGSESYAPLMQPVTGRMVSPDLPSLPDADRFLPNGVFKGYIWPARGVLSSGYGWRWGRMHQGIDIASDVGTPIHAAATGVVEYAGWNSGGYGNMVEIRHPDGSMTRYAHMNAILVQEGQRVAQGDQIGEMGSTGYSTGPHLHFEVHLAQGTVNPMAYLPAQ